MITPPVQVERRIAQRFPFLLPVSFRSPGSGAVGIGCTQNLSSRGALFLTDTLLREGDLIEVTVTMPSEITLGESMRVRCHGHVLRAAKAADPPQTNPSQTPADTSSLAGTDKKIAVAVRLEKYEYLTESASEREAPRAAVLHTHIEEDQPQVAPPRR